MSAHEEFEQLCALATTGDLSPDEFRSLGKHLYECANCRASYRDFHAIIQRGLPTLEPRPSTNWFSPRFGMKKRFLARAQKEGIAIGDVKPRRTRMWWIVAPATVTVVLIFAGLTHEWLVYQSGRAREAEAAKLIAALSSKVTELERRLEVNHQAVPDSDQRLPGPQPLPSAAADADRARELETQLALLRNDYAALVAQKELLDQRASMLSGEADKLRGEEKRARDEAARLQNDLQRVESASRSREPEAAPALSASRSADAITIPALRARIDQLENSLDQQKKALEREQQLLSASEEIRNLMQSRDLMMVNVYDVGSPGKMRQMPGRIFLDQGRSFTFYAWDLQNKAAVDKRDFQVWGRKEGRLQTTFNLGILYVDDPKQNRWVLRFKDSAVLDRIDQVFVTVEQLGGSPKPTKDPFLIANFLSNTPGRP